MGIDLLGEATMNENTSDIEMNEDGSVNPHESKADKDRRIRRERIDSIRDKIADPNYDPSEISRDIAVEIAWVAGNMVSNEGGLQGPAVLKAYEQQVKALRELGRQLTDADILSKKDVLNFDGPKFQFVAEIWVNTFVQAMKEAGTPEDMRNSIMKHFRDRMQMSENQIRRETAKIDSTKVIK